MVANLNYVAHSAMPPPRPTAPVTESAVGDSSNASQPDAPPPPSIIQMRIWPYSMQAFAPNNNACTQEIFNVIKSMYNHPWSNYTKIPAETKGRWFHKWTAKIQCC
ncbi:uncharacterized protein DS421_3g105460 [Arachis hypogaea]|nr:uncharacterized protein DS421_3g105460 [Arachis hypogaea]